MNKHPIGGTKPLNNHKQLLKIMRISLFLLFFSVLVSQSANTFSQETKLSINLKSSTIKDVCKEIEKNSSYSFVFSGNANKLATKQVDINANAQDIEQILDNLLAGTKLAYRILEKQVVVYERGTEIAELMGLGYSRYKLDSFQQKKYVLSGTVVDKNRDPLIGVNIVIKGHTGSGCITDKDGSFTIESTVSEELLVFSYIGFETKQQIVREGVKQNIVLNESVSEIEEVVVTGYQVVDRRESASSVYTVRAKDIMLGSSKSIDQMLSGVVPGMAVLTSSGEPSANPKIRIRGNATINGNKAPVWVVDGVILEDPVPFNAADLNSEDAVYLIGNAISGINPQDIETITVLKDASATAIYGVKAANGVIVVTTKKGVSGKAVITYNGNTSINKRPSYSDFDRMSAKERMQLSREIVELGYRYPRVPSGDTYEGVLQQLYKKDITYSEFESRVKLMGERNTDWYKELFRNSVSNNHNLSISGGGVNSSYYLSIGYNNNLGATSNSSSSRFTSLAKVNVNISDNIKFQAKINYSSTDNSGFHETVNPHSYAYKTSRTLAPYDKDGNYSMYVADQLYGLNYNFLQEMSYTGKTGKINDFNGLFNLDVRLAKGLSYQGVFSLQNNDSKTRRWAEEQSYYISRIRGYNYHQFDETNKKFQDSRLPYGGILNHSIIGLESYTLRNTLNYKEMFDYKHDFQIMAGVETRSARYKGLDVTGYGWIPEFGEKFMPIYTDNFVNSYVRTGFLNPINTNRITQVASMFGILTYSYMYKYTLNANIRSDGANKFGSNPRYRWLPTWSIAGKWDLSREDILSENNWVNYLALRASYGVQGNIHDDSSPELIVQIQNKDQLSQLDKYKIYRLPNPNLRWEKTNSCNVATDFTLFDKRLKGSFEVYKKHTTDLIHNKSVPSSNGRQVLTINSGSMDNNGFEGFFNLDIIRSKSFDWNTSFNFARNINRIILANEHSYSKMEEVEMMLRGETAFEGEAIGTMYSYRFAGLSGENGFPLFYSKDGRKVHIGEPQLMELVKSGSIFPKITGGFDHQFTFRNRLSLGFGFYYNFGGAKRLPSVYDDANNLFDPFYNVSREVKNRWKKPGDELTTTIPAIYNKDIISSIINEDKLVAIKQGSLDYLYPTQLYNNSDIQVATANFLRLRHISLSYMFDRPKIQKYGLTNCAIRFQATNLHVFASKKWRGLDPETPNSSIPILPVYSLGLNLSF